MNLDDAIAQYVANSQGVLKGSAANFAQAGQYVWVQLLGGRTIRCRAGGVINSTQVSVVLTDSGEGFAFCETAPKVTRSTVQRWVKSRPGGSVVTRDIKYVLQKTVAGVTSLWVCGHQQQCVKVLDFGISKINSCLPIRLDQYNIGPGDISFTTKAKRHKGIIKNNAAMNAKVRSKNLFMSTFAY